MALGPSAAHVFGLDIGHDHARVVLSNLVGTLWWDESVDLDVGGSAENTIAAATRLIDQALRTTGIARTDILGLGVGVACPVDRATGPLGGVEVQGDVLERDRRLPHPARRGEQRRRPDGVGIRIRRDRSTTQLETVRAERSTSRLVRRPG
jgi:hypothetical protein